MYISQLLQNPRDLTNGKIVICVIHKTLYFLNITGRWYPANKKNIYNVIIKVSNNRNLYSRVSETFSVGEVVLIYIYKKIPNKKLS